MPSQIGKQCKPVQVYSFSQNYLFNSYAIKVRLHKIWVRTAGGYYS